jgi:putative membrane protein
MQRGSVHLLTVQNTPSEPAAANEPAETVAPPERETSILGNLIRGALIGAAETVPGISGGTVALVVGIYHQIIDSASEVISALRRLITGPDRARAAKAELARVHWKIVIPVLIGMIAVLLTIAGPMADLMEEYPARMRGLFFGMVLVSAVVPVRMMLHDQRSRRAQLQILGEDPSHVRLRWRHLVLGIVAVNATFLLVSLPPQSVNPQPAIIVAAAAIAVSALVLPGLSGSFLLLSFGLYEPTLRAVDQRDLGYLGFFLLGAVIGMIVIVKALKWLLEHYHTATLAVLTGVMLGGLRTLWPWQADNRALLGAPEAGEAWTVFGVGVIGAIAVLALIIADARLTRR